MRKLFTLFLCLCTFVQLYAYLPVGWATCNGGTTGGTASPTTVTSATQLSSALKSNAVIYISGTIQLSAKITAQNLSNLTIYGLPGSALVAQGYTKTESGILEIKNCSNVIIQNVTFKGKGAYDCDGYDNLFLNGSTNVWVDHCDFQDGSDGCLDITNQSNYVSVTYCRFRYLIDPIPGGSGGSDDHRFTNLIGGSDSSTGDAGKLKTTFQYCWWDEGCKGRMPRVRYGQVHVVNSLFTSTAADRCIEIAYDADVYIDKNVFINSVNPVKGHDGVTYNVTYTDNLTSGTSGTDTEAEIQALSGYQGAATWNPYTAYCSTMTTIAADNVQTKVTTTAGATLTSNSPELAAEGSTISVSGSASQTVQEGNAISNIIYTAGGTATQISVSNLPAGLSSSISGLSLTISGTPTASGTYTITATDGTTSVYANGTITVQEAGSEPVTSDFWNFSDDAFNALGTLSSSTTINGLTLTATAEKTMTITESAATLDGNNFTHALGLGGGGSIGSYRTASFAVTGNCTVTIYAAAGGTSGTRNLMLSDGTDTYGQTTTTTTPTKYEYEYNGNAATTLYVYSSSSGINLYGIKIGYVSTATIENAVKESSSIIWNGEMIENLEHKTIQVFNMSGMLIYSGNENVYLPQNGIYIVRVPETNECIKILK